MLRTFDETVTLINQKKLLHISASEALLRKLPNGSWIGGSTEYFMAQVGGVISGDMLHVDELNFSEYRIAEYDDGNLPNIAKDAYDNGFTIVVLPYDSAVLKRYAQDAASYDGMFLKNIVGWVSGINLGAAGQTPVTANGKTGQISACKAVALHVSLPANQSAAVSILNIFEADASKPEITFPEDGFSVGKCFVDGREYVFADYISQNALDTKLPLVGDYSGAGINVSIKSIDNGAVNMFAPVFAGVSYRFAKAVPDYEGAYKTRLKGLPQNQTAFACNCVLNFLYGELEGKRLGGPLGPITFGEVAWQLLNQTLVYLTITENKY